MDRKAEESSYSKAISQGTGSQDLAKEYKIAVIPFGKYEITLRLPLETESVEILEVKVNKDFLSYEQKKASKGFHDVEDFYKK
jgi:hypothetical protein